MLSTSLSQQSAICEALPSRRGPRAHHAQKDRVGSWGIPARRSGKGNAHDCISAELMFRNISAAFSPPAACQLPFAPATTGRQPRDLVSPGRYCPNSDRTVTATHTRRREKNLRRCTARSRCREVCRQRRTMRDHAVACIGFGKSRPKHGFSIPNRCWRRSAATGPLAAAGGTAGGSRDHGPAEGTRTRAALVVVANAPSPHRAPIRLHLGDHPRPRHQYRHHDDDD